MTTLHLVKRSRKEQTDSKTKEKIPVGSSYYWWQFAFGPKMISKTQPNKRQLTQSEYDITVMDIQDMIDEIPLDGLEEGVQSVIDAIDTLKDECEEKLSNMPENLQESSQSGNLLQERIDELDNWSSNIGSIDLDIGDDEDKDDRLQDIIDEMQGP